jgi:hypothetical protein
MTLGSIRISPTSTFQLSSVPVLWFTEKIKRYLIVGIKKEMRK